MRHHLSTQGLSQRALCMEWVELNGGTAGATKVNGNTTKNTVKGGCALEVWTIKGLCGSSWLMNSTEETYEGEFISDKFVRGSHITRLGCTQIVIILPLLTSSTDAETSTTGRSKMES